MAQSTDATGVGKRMRAQGPNYLSPAFYLEMAIFAAVDYIARKNKGPAAAILDPILVDFKRGVSCGIGGVAEEILAEKEAETAWERRDFFREGYAFGLAAVHSLIFSRGNPEGRNRDPHNFRIMHYTGYGFWNGVAAKMYLPRIPDDPSCWLDVPDFLRFAPFIAGGDAFGRLVLQRHVTPEFFRSFERTADPVATEAAWHGCGRAIWFRWTGDMPALVPLLQSYPPATSAIALGLGMAITFTQIGSPDRVRESIASFPTSFHDLLAQGGGVALAGMTFDNPRESERVYALYTGDLRRRVDEALQAAEEARMETLSAPERWYGSFFARLEAMRPRDHATSSTASLVSQQF